MEKSQKLESILNNYIQEYGLPDSNWDYFIYYNRLIDRMSEEAQVERRLSYDVNALVTFYEITIQEVELNLNLGYRVRKTNGRCRKTKEGTELIELNYTDNHYVKHYVLAHEFSHIILQYIREIIKEEDTIESKTCYCIDPFFSRTPDEFFANMLASLMLLPFDSVLEYMKLYCEKLKEQNKYPLEATEWINSLGRQAQLSSYHTIVSYQYVKYLICAYFESDNSECHEVASKLESLYAELIEKSR